jgi:hypothetical protein
MNRKAAALVLLPALMMWGCEEGTDRDAGTIAPPPPPTTAAPAPDVGVPPQVQQAVTTAEQKIQDLQMRLSQFRQQATNLQGEHRERVLNSVQEAEDALQECQDKVNQLVNATSANWQDHNREVQTALNEAQQKVDQIQIELQNAGDTGMEPLEPVDPIDPPDEPIEPAPPGTGEPPSGGN